MSNKTTGFLLFLVGAAVGSAATWKYAKDKYEQIAQEEIDSVKETFSNRLAVQQESGIDEAAEVPTKQQKATLEKTKPDISEYAAMIRKQGYTEYSKKGVDTQGEEEPEQVDTPYVISPDEFGEYADYEQVSLNYFADQILVDDNDEIVDDVEGTIGFEALTHFGEYEDDSVFVRNDRLKCDYEILLDHRAYSDVIDRKPHQVDD